MTSGSSRPGQRLRVAGSALIAGVLALSLASCALSIGGLQHRSNSYTIGSGVSTLVVTNQAGDIDVTGGSSATVSVTEHISFRGTAPATTHRLAAGTLTLGGTCPAAETCTVDYTITAPRRITARIMDDAGTVTLGSLAGSVTTHVNAGKITLSSLAGPVAATCNAGPISAKGLSSATVSLHVSAGQIDVAFSAPPTAVTAATDVGPVTVRVPDSVRYNVTAAATVGNVHISVSRSAAAPRTISATTKTGSITVEPAT